ncbi:hypothetical protein [Paenibacillus caui]|uniref:hypothetical protein n=1 Tax=Paenibacillus caui TaxID=2873927 RepID=UPI001CA9F621|nr:hypothetical protein [Paenibacillus caui]
MNKNGYRIWIISTMALTLTIGGALWKEQTGARAALNPDGKTGLLYPFPPAFTTEFPALAPADPFLQTLGAADDNEVYEALFDGKSLADIAEANQADVQAVIDLQTSEMNKLLSKRLEEGSLTPEDYQSQKAELSDMITASAYGKNI